MPRRIVSLVPSLSETLVDFGLRSELVGCTQFCVRPRDLYKTARSVGGTKDFSIEQILDLQASHVIANQEENPRQLIEELALKVPVLVTYPRGPSDVPEMLRSMGRFLDFAATAETWALAMEAALSRWTREGTAARSSFLYFIWQNPYMIAGPDTYISRLLSLAGWSNSYQGPDRYPSLDREAIQTLNPELIMLSSEPFPFKKRHAQSLRQGWSQAPRMARVDGQLLSWYGSSTLRALSLLALSEGRIEGELGSELDP